jgi:hypothetical protein
MNTDAATILDDAVADEVKKRFTVFVENLSEESPVGNINPGDAVKMFRKGLFNVFKARAVAESVVTELIKSTQL